MVHSPQQLQRRAPHTGVTTAAGAASYSARLLANMRTYPPEALLAPRSVEGPRKPRRTQPERAAPEAKFYCGAAKTNKKDAATALRKSRGFAVVGDREGYPRKDLENLRRGNSEHVLPEPVLALRHKERCSDSCRCSQSSTATSSTGDETSSCSGYSSSGSSAGTPVEASAEELFQRRKVTSGRSDRTEPVPTSRRRRNERPVNPPDRSYRISPTTPWRKQLPVPGSEPVPAGRIAAATNAANKLATETTPIVANGPTHAQSAGPERSQPQAQTQTQPQQQPQQPTTLPSPREQALEREQAQQQQPQQPQQRKGGKQSTSPFVFELSLEDQQMSADVACAYYTQTFPVDVLLHRHLVEIYQATEEILTEHAVQAAQTMEEVKRRATEEWLKSRTEEERRQYMSRLS